MYLSIIFILVLFLLFHYMYFIHSGNNIQKKKIHIYFLNKKEIQYFIEKDTDNFIKSLNSINLIARKSKSNQKYKEKSIKSCTQFKKSEQEKLINANFKNIQKLKHVNLIHYGINTKKLLDIAENTKIGLTSDEIYEDGMPHTRNDIIFLSTNYLKKNIHKSKKLQYTLFHEWIHIYQRIHQREYSEWLIQNGWKMIQDVDSTKKRINPDLDTNIWEKDEKIYIGNFKSELPKSLNDIDFEDSKWEHPFEYYAYEITSYLMKK